MRIPTLTTCIALTLATAAVAGPMAMEKNVAPVAPACTWTGFYVGINGGVGWQKSNFTNNDTAGYESNDEFGKNQTTTWDNVNGIVGGQVGFNYQWRDLVIGIEADADYSGNSINKTPGYGTYPEAGNTVEAWVWQEIARIDFQGSVRARIGISLLDNKALVYVTGGVAIVHGDWQSNDLYYTTSYDTAYDIRWQGDDWRFGLIGGAGIEYKLNCHWSIKAEALYTWLAEDEQNPSFVGSTLVSSYNYNGQEKYTFGDKLYSARLGLNYAFSGFFGH